MRGRMAGMPATKQAFMKLLAVIEQQVMDAQRRLLATTNDDERTALINLVADLNIRQSELKALLGGDDPPNNRGMETLKVGDWVRTASGREGKIVLISRMSAFLELQDRPENRAVSFLLSELTKMEPPPENNPPSAH